MSEVRGSKTPKYNGSDSIALTKPLPAWSIPTKARLKHRCSAKLQPYPAFDERK